MPAISRFDKGIKTVIKTFRVPDGTEESGTVIIDTVMMLFTAMWNKLPRKEQANMNEEYHSQMTLLMRCMPFKEAAA